MLFRFDKPDENPFHPLISKMLDEGRSGEEVAAMLVENAGDLTAAFTRTEGQCRDFCERLSTRMEQHALGMQHYVNTEEREGRLAQCKQTA